MKNVVLLALLLLPITSFAQEIQQPPFKSTTNRQLRSTPSGVQTIVSFMEREKMRDGKAAAPMFKPQAVAKAPALPIDWAKDLSFPMYLNDQLGICYYAAGAHLDNTWTGNVSTKSEFNLTVMRQRYFTLSGGDNGLTDSEMQGEMKGRYLADVTQAKVVDYCYIDVKDPATVQAAIHYFGGVMFTLACPTAWINDSDTGSVWDNGVANPRNGHAVIFNGVDLQGRYKLQTWGTYVWITPRGVNVCDPDGWIAFSARWFAPSGYAPNGLHVTQLAQIWKDSGGRAIPASVINSFPPPSVEPPPPPPPPTPGLVTLKTITETFSDGSSKKYDVLPVGAGAKIQELLELLAPRAADAAMADPSRARIQELEKNVSTLTNAILRLQKLLVDPPKKTGKTEPPSSKESDRVEVPHPVLIGPRSDYSIGALPRVTPLLIGAK